jgi:hypothetical protein
MITPTGAGGTLAITNPGTIVSPASTAPHAFAYEASDIPAGMTIREYRAKRARKPGRTRRLRRALRARRHTLRLA